MTSTEFSRRSALGFPGGLQRLHRVSTNAFVAGALALLTACGGGGGGSSTTVTAPPLAPPATPPVAQSCGVEAQKDFVLSVAQDWYRWYDEMAVVDPADFASAQALLSALTAPLAEDFRDPGFSFLTTIAEDEATLGTGAFVGFGFRFAIDDAGRYLISDVYESGTAFAAGFVRGAELLAVDRGNGFATMRELENQGESLDSIFGPPVNGLERGFRLRIDGETIEVVAAKADLDVPPLAAAPRLIERSGLSPVGYFHLRSFTNSANAALESAFAEFLEQDITDFVIDLRYNSGGLVDVADRLLDLLGGRIASGEVSFTISHNDKRAAENFQSVFFPRSNSVTPLRIAFLTSESTASASELLINSLAPELEVVLVGGDTSGKAVGQYAFDLPGCDTRLRLVAFETLNGDGFGGYYTGLVDTGRFTLCAAEDDYRDAFGSPRESLLAGALGWLNEGVCEGPTPTGLLDRSAGIRRVASPFQQMDRPDRRSLWVQ